LTLTIAPAADATPGTTGTPGNPGTPSTPATAQTCQITGAPTTATPADTPVTITITGTNSTDSSTATVKLVVQTPTPNLIAPSEPLILTAQIPLAAPILFFTNIGDSVSPTTGCTITAPANGLPTGLRAQTITQSNNIVGCALDGTPQSASAEQAYTVTARTAEGGEASMNITITVNDLPAIPTACTDATLAKADSTANYPLTDATPRTRLYLSGAHANNEIQNEFLFRHKGENIYQAAAIFDSIGAAADYDPTNAQFAITTAAAAIAGTPGSSRIEGTPATPNTPEIPAIPATDATPATPARVDATYRRAVPAQGEALMPLDLYDDHTLTRAANNAPTDLAPASTTLADGRAFIFTFTAAQADTDNIVQSATLTIEDCTAPDLPATATATLANDQTNIPPITITALETSGFIKDCTLSGTPPGTLTARVATNRAACEITGDAGDTAGDTTITVTATNTAGTDTTPTA
ncbi:MAG: hypothetical protein K8963_04870, partial [Proteobacteria bacterium]|nr:hypothetical protein [Pseudomonadota bacterium]